MFFDDKQAIALGDHLLKQARVLDQHGGLRGECHQQFLIIFVEFIARLFVDDFNHADGFVFVEQRSGNHGGGGEFIVLVDAVEKTGINRHVVDDDRSFAGKDPARNAFIVFDAFVAQGLAAAALHDLKDQFFARRIEQEE